MKTKKIKGKNYKERSRYQLEEWVEGNSICNKIDGECCPDMSCCNPDLLVDKDERIRFKVAFYNVKDAESEQVMLNMQSRYLMNALSAMGKADKVYIAGSTINDDN
jgi:hypothetical protein